MAFDIAWSGEPGLYLCGLQKSWIDKLVLNDKPLNINL